MGVPAPYGRFDCLVADGHPGPPDYYRDRITVPDEPFAGVSRYVSELQLPGADDGKQVFAAGDLAAEHVDDEEVAGQDSGK